MLENCYLSSLEKYTWNLEKKDYWNFVSESLPKDELIKSVQSFKNVSRREGFFLGRFGARHVSFWSGFGWNLLHPCGYSS